MSNRVLAPFLVMMVVACSAADDGPAVDAAVVPVDPTGWFTLRSTLSIAEPPVAMTTALAELTLATDGPDDPSRYLVDLIVDCLPDGWTKVYAAQLAPFLAAYVDTKVAQIAPRFLPGVHALADGTNQIARRFGTLEDLQIARDGRATRTITGLVFDKTDVVFAPLGIGDLAAVTTASLADEALAIGAHTVAIDYAQVLRLGLDRAVIPTVTPGCTDLACALAQLVDCPALGVALAEKVGFGPPTLYASACAVGLTAAAAKIYAGLPRAGGQAIVLEVRGQARGVDRDRDGYLDAIEAGTWSGTFDRAPLAAGSFTGTLAR